jgi:uncharacterized membrane protein (DUF2068 family)
MSRPQSYTIAAILMLLSSLVGITRSIPALTPGAAVPSADTPPIALTVLSFTLGVLGIVTAYGVWRMQKWGVILAIVVAALGILTFLPTIMFASPPLRLVAVLGVVWSSVIVVLLLRPAPTTTLD